MTLLGMALLITTAPRTYHVHHHFNIEIRVPITAPGTNHYSDEAFQKLTGVLLRATSPLESILQEPATEEFYEEPYGRSKNSQSPAKHSAKNSKRENS